MAAPEWAAWPSIPVSDWVDTRDTLHLYTQVVGKVRMVNEPMSNHWWNVPLYVTARGLTTSPIPHPTGPVFQIDFDFIDHRLDVETVTGQTRSVELVPRTVAEFHRIVMDLLDELGVGTEIWSMPVEIAGAIPFPDDTIHASYDADAVQRFWAALVEMERVMKTFRSRFLGKASPIHYFWGAIDLAHTRFSGRTAPPHPGGAPNCGPHVMWEAYSHEVSSCGYWPGLPGEEGIFYGYAYPEPPGCSELHHVARIPHDEADHGHDRGAVPDHRLSDPPRNSTPSPSGQNIRSRNTGASTVPDTTLS